MSFKVGDFIIRRIADPSDLASHFSVSSVIEILGDGRLSCRYLTVPSWTIHGVHTQLASEYREATKEEIAAEVARRLCNRLY
jgi:hypothetical protein